MIKYQRKMIKQNETYQAEANQILAECNSDEFILKHIPVDDSNFKEGYINGYIVGRNKTDYELLGYLKRLLSASKSFRKPGSVLAMRIDETQRYLAYSEELPIDFKPVKTIEEKVTYWLAYCQRELSSEFMCQTLSGINIKATDHYPWDFGDFGRCYRLLEVVPEFKEKLHLMKKVSREWSILIDNWDKLSEIYNKELAFEKTETTIGKLIGDLLR